MLSEGKDDWMDQFGMNGHKKDSIFIGKTG
jgi:hypothetical protein